MSDEVAEIVERIASLFQQAFGIFRHVRARLYEDVFAFGHTDSPVARTQLDAFRAFPERTERLGVNLQHFVVLFMYAFVRNKESHGRVAPKVAGLRIVLITVCRIFISSDNQCFACLPTSKISFDDLKRVHERRTGRRDGECFGILNSIGVLYDMSGCADGVVR